MFTVESMTANRIFTIAVVKAQSKIGMSAWPLAGPAFRQGLIACELLALLADSKENMSSDQLAKLISDVEYLNRCNDPTEAI